MHGGGSDGAGLFGERLCSTFGSLDSDTLCWFVERNMYLAEGEG